MKLVLTTVVSADEFAGYLPLFHYCAARYLTDWSVRTFVRGRLPDDARKAYGALNEAYPGIELPIENYCLPKSKTLQDPFSTNVTRWFLDESQFADLKPDWVLITDADLLLFNDPLSWHLLQTIGDNRGIACHHGPWHKPRRPEICSGWSGMFERVAGGFVMVNNDWFRATLKARANYAAMMRTDTLPFPMFREADEVILGRILADSGIPIPTAKAFPAELRGVHLGDFKGSMTHRWQDMTKMGGILTNFNCLSFRTVEATETWQQMLNCLYKNTLVTETLENMRTHISKRGL
jgi:hypothetical protein